MFDDGRVSSFSPQGKERRPNARAVIGCTFAPSASSSFLSRFLESLQSIATRHSGIITFGQ